MNGLGVQESTWYLDWETYSAEVSFQSNVDSFGIPKDIVISEPGTQTYTVYGPKAPSYLTATVTNVIFGYHGSVFVPAVPGPNALAVFAPGALGLAGMMLRRRK